MKEDRETRVIPTQLEASVNSERAVKNNSCEVRYTRQNIDQALQDQREEITKRLERLHEIPSEYALLKDGVLESDKLLRKDDVIKAVKG